MTFYLTHLKASYFDLARVKKPININWKMENGQVIPYVTLSTLFQTYCMNLYGSQMWRYNDKTTRSFYTCWRKAIRRLYNIPYRTHNILVHHIINSYPIDVVLEKRCIKYIWNLINSGCKLHADIVILSMDNMYSTINCTFLFYVQIYI